MEQDQGPSKDVRDSATAAGDETFLVTFDPDDAENPLNWPNKLKLGVTAAVSGTGFVRIMVSTVSCLHKLRSLINLQGLTLTTSVCR